MPQLQYADPWAAQQAYLQEQAAAAQRAAQAAAAALPAPGAPVDPAVAPPATQAPVAAPSPTQGFEDYLARQTGIGAVKTLDAWKQAPASVRRVLLTGAVNDYAVTNKLAPGDVPAAQRSAFAKYDAMVAKGGAYGSDSPTLNAAYDVGASLVGGAVGAVKSMADLAGNDNAVSAFLGEVGKALEGSKTAESARKSAWAQARVEEALGNGHTTEAIKEWFDGALARPGETLANLAGSFVTAGLGKAAQAVGVVKTAVGATRVTAGLAGVQGAGAARQQIYDQTQRDALSGGATPSEAAAVAERAARLGNASVALAVNAAIGVVAGGTGADRLLMGGARMGGVKGFSRAVGIEGSTEGGQSFSQTVTGNLASQGAGVRTAPVLDGRVALDTVTGAAMGVVGGAGAQGVARVAYGAVQPATAPGGAAGATGAGGDTPAPTNPTPEAQAAAAHAAGVAPAPAAAAAAIPPGGPTRVETTPVPGEMDTWEELTPFAKVMTPNQEAAVRGFLDRQGFVSAPQMEELGITLTPSERVISLPDPAEVAAPILDIDLAAEAAQAALLSEGTRTRLREGGPPATAASLMADIEADARANTVEKGLAKWLGTRLEGVTVQAYQGVTGLDGGAVRGLYDPDARLMHLDADHGMTRHAALHEAVHAVTLDTMRAPVESLDANSRAARDEVSAIYAHVMAADPTVAELYAVPNEVEFIAQALSLPELQDHLRATEWRPDQSAWVRITQGLRSMIGLPETALSNTAWAAVLDAAEVLALPTSAPTGRPAVGGASVPLTAGEAPRDKDTMYARMDGDSKATMRGMAVLNPTGTWDATWLHANGTTLRRTRPDLEAAKNWLEARGAGSTVVTYQARSFQSGRLDKVKGELEALSPGAKQFMRVLNRATMGRLTDDTLLHYARQAAGLWRAQVGRYAGTNALREQFAGTAYETRTGEASMASRASRARSDRTTQGMNGVDSWFDSHTAAVQQRANMRAAGVPDAVASDFAYAYSAAQLNSARLQEFPTDLVGRLKGGDFAKFHYYADKQGTIVDVPNGAQAPAWATKQDGPTAALDFQVQFAAQFPAAQVHGDKLLAVIAAGNAHVLKTQLANGAIKTSEFAALMKLPLYLPMRQINKTNRAHGPRATGRSSKADDPLAQWLTVSATRIDHAWAKGALKDIALALREHPNPQIATLNSSTAKLAPASPLDPSKSLVDLVRDDWADESTARVYIGNEAVSINFAPGAAQDIAKALRSDGTMTDETINSWLNAARFVTRWQAFSRTGLSPAFLAKTLSWDSLTAVANIQGAFKGINASSDITNGQAARMALKVIPRAVVNLRQALARSLESAEMTRTSVKRSPARMLYDTMGGGIHMEARGQFVTMKHMLVGDASSLGRKALDAGASTINFVGAVGHAYSDALRFSAFEAYLQDRNGGRPFTTEAQATAFARSRPADMEAAIIGSKNLLGNFETMGQNVLLRAFIPFLNAGLVGTTQVLPSLLSSAHGRRSLALMAGVGLLGAVAAMGTEEDKTKDGYSKYLDSDNSWKSLHAFGLQVPVPPELGLLVLAVNASAAFITRADGHEVDINRLAAEGHHRVMDFIPVRPAPFEEAPLATALGIVGPLFLAADGRDAFGQSFRAPEPRGPNGTRLAVPDFMRGRTQDPMWAHDLAAGMATAGIDMPPGIYKLWWEQVAGAGAQMLTQYIKGEDMQAAGQATSGASELLTWVGKDYALKENPFAAIERQRDSLRAITGVVARDEEGNSIAQLRAKAGQARKAGDAGAYEELMIRAKNLNEAAVEATAPARLPGASGTRMLQ